ncbi:hypothetical protein HPB48_019538 [Haemaphysalis longicornis]|uniref:small monomeric GTPase n=1 Tax=Haemaphysalis longicornis TaxID=44386 RepID=A0A9J6GXE9_HAELO|nr:hypothetical protein HPB48_019538 [Haemaphysalis longicornis]
MHWSSCTASKTGGASRRRACACRRLNSYVPAFPQSWWQTNGTYHIVRQVDVDDGRQLSLSVQCQFYEVSAADSYAQVSMAFQSILREVLATKILRSLTPVRRRLTVVTVSRMLGAVFGKNAKRHKKRPSLSL